MEFEITIELDKLKWDYEYAGGKIKTKCPFHKDEHPSCSLDTESRKFKCWATGCNAHGDFIAFINKLRKEDLNKTWQYLQDEYGMTRDKTINPSLILKCHNDIWKATLLKQKLYDRGLTDNDIVDYKLGVKDGKITIPITNKEGHFVNLRRYIPGAEGHKKFANHRGCGKNRLFPVSQLRYDTILIAGGEIKAIAAARQLNPHKIGVISCTSGEGNWDGQFTKEVQDKKLYICMDIDDAGQEAAKRLCNLLCHSTDFVGNMLLPLDIVKYPHGDINDYIAIGGDLHSLLDTISRWEFVGKTQLDNSDPIYVDFSKTSDPVLAGKRIKFKAVVAGIHESPYQIPKVVCIECNQDQKECGFCEVKLSGQKEFAIHPESDCILELISTNKKNQKVCVAETIGIPRTCKAWDQETKERYKVEDVRVSPQLDISSKVSERTLQPAVMILPEKDVELNESYIMTGRTWPHPNTQEATMVISTHEPTQDILSNYECSNTEALEIFQPKEWTKEGVRDKLNDIYEDLEANATQIYQRRDLHLAIDLVYHSILFIKFDKKVVKGWVEALILGDTSQGKSLAVEGLMNHYGLGELVVSKNSSLAGIIGGVQPINGKWFITWGILPAHDRRLVIFEEYGEAPEDLSAGIKDTRTRGIAQITKIEKRKTHARARLLFVSNPKTINGSFRALKTYNYGIDAIKELIGSPADLRRFDYAIVLNEGEVDIRSLQTLRKNKENVYTPELCHELVLWAWTRDEIVFESEQFVLDAANRLTEKYVEESIALVDGGSMRYKIARLAAALASRTFSCEGDILYVRNCHVEFIEEFIDTTYSSEAFGYYEYSQNIRVYENLQEPEFITAKINSLPHPRDFVRGCITQNNLDLNFMLDYSGLDRTEAQALISFLVRKNALKKVGRGYFKSISYLSHLKHLEKNGALVDKPDFIRKEQF